MRVFYGWWIVAACMLAALFGNALGLFGAGVYLHEVVKANGWTIGLVSGAVTLFYVVSAFLLIPVGSGIRHFGPGLIVALAGIALASGVIEVGRATVPWQVYLAVLLMGIGWAGLSTTAVATTLAPWFDRHQGRATSIASPCGSLPAGGGKLDLSERELVSRCSPTARKIKICARRIVVISRNSSAELRSRPYK
jgi:MFS family permease